MLTESELLREAAESGTGELVEECRQLLGAVMPLQEKEVEFLNRLNDDGAIVPELITEDEEERRIISIHPGLLWKALNVRRHAGQRP